MFIRPFLIATAVLIPHIYGQLFVPLLIDNLAELAIAESLGPSEDVSFFLSQTPNFAEFVSFLLYRTIQDDGVVLPTDPASLSQSPMDPTIPTKIIVVGFLTEPDAEPSLLLRSVYLETGEYNFIVVNWTRISKDLNFPRVRTYVRGVASAIGKFLDALADSGVCLPKDQHIIGHSLGGHLAGLAAMAAKTRPGRCTGLDPSAPLFELASSEGRIDSSVATIVDVIHTAAGSWGLATPVGHVDFYVNGGTWPQPDCRGSFHDLDGYCSHMIELHYFANTIRHPTVYIGNRCQRSSIIMGFCPENSAAAVMGEYVVFDTPGLYYVEARLNKTGSRR